MTPAPQSAAPVASLERRFYAFALDRAIAWSLVGLSGLAEEDLQPGMAVQLLPGAVIDLGDGVTIRVTNL